MESSRPATVAGGAPRVKMALSPEPIPSMARPPESSSIVEIALAVTTRCRVRGLVTSGPSRTRRVLRAATVRATYSSRNTDCESATPRRSNPLSSASRQSAPKPPIDSGRSTTPHLARGSATEAALILQVDGHRADHLEAECLKMVQALRWIVGQDPQLPQPEIAQDPSADAEVAAIHGQRPGAGALDPGEIRPVGIARERRERREPAGEALGDSLPGPVRPEIHEHAMSLGLDRPERRAQHTVGGVRLVAKHVAQEVAPVHPHQGGLAGLHRVTRRIEPARIAQAECQMGQPIDDAPVGDDLEAPVVGVDDNTLGRCQAMNQALSLQPVVNDLLDGANL